MLGLLEQSPFVDFVEKFRKDHGIALVIDEAVENKIKQYAKENGIPISTAIGRLLHKASALNYMDLQGKFTITEQMLDNPRYFDDLYVKWRLEQTDGTTDAPEQAAPVQTPEE